MGLGVLRFRVTYVNLTWGLGFRGLGVLKLMVSYFKLTLSLGGFEIKSSIFQANKGFRVKGFRGFGI